MTPFYERDNVTLYSGDSLLLLGELPSNSVDAIITDPPYSSGGAFRGDRSASTGYKYVGDSDLSRPNFMGDNRDQHSFFKWCALWLSDCLRIAKPGSPICVFTDWRQLAVTTDAIQIGGWVWRGIIPWNKTESVRPQQGRFRNQCEYIVWGSKGPMPTNRQVPVIPGFFQAVVKQSDKFHQTGKPTLLMREIVRICVPGGVVLDPFCGSGTTCLAALLEGRKSIGIEQSPDYLRVAVSRLDQIQPQLSLEFTNVN